MYNLFCITAQNLSENVTHSLAGIQMPDEVVVCHHLLDRVGEGEGDREGETLGHRYHQHRHTDNHELHVVVDIVHVPVRALNKVHTHFLMLEFYNLTTWIPLSHIVCVICSFL